MKNSAEKLKELQSLWLKVGRMRFDAHLNTYNEHEEKIFMAFISVQNAIADYENSILDKIDNTHGGIGFESLP